MKIIKFIKYLVFKVCYPNNYSNEAYVNHLRIGGAIVGDGTFFYGHRNHPVDETSLPFIEIGSNCRITDGVRILAHDYSYSVLRPIYHAMYRKCSVTLIGNNVFIGINSIVLPGAKIGDNVIVGAGSIISGVIPSNVVVAGNPAKIICTIEEYKDKLEKSFEYNAALFYKRQKAYLKRDIFEDDMNWYCALWDTDKKRTIFEEIKVDGDDKESVIHDQLKIKSKYSSFEDFINFANTVN